MNAYVWPSPKRIPTCATCGAEMAPGISESGRCRRCAAWWRRHGDERPYGLEDGRVARCAKERA